MHFDKVIKTYGFIKNGEEPCIYKWVNNSVIVFLILYVDDILLIGNDISALQEIKVWLSSQFSMKDLGEASFILGMKIYRDRSKRLLELSQSMYINTETIQHDECQKRVDGTFLAVQWLRLHLPMQPVQIQSLVRYLRSHMPHGQRNQKVKQKQYCNKLNKD